MKSRRVKSGLSSMMLAVILLLLLNSLAPGQKETMSDKQTLPTDAPVEVEVVGNNSVPYEINLKPGEFFQVRVEQKDFEILLRLLDAGGKELARMSSPKEKEGLETLSFVASEAASYKLAVSLLNEQSGKGKYAIRREPPRTATALDRRRVEVERLFADGMIARDTGGQAEIAIEKFSEALQGWRELGDEYMAQLSNLLVIRSQARATFLEAKKLIMQPQGEAGRTAFLTALEKFQDARRLYHEGGETFNEGASFLGAALAEQGLGNVEATISFVELSLPIYSREEHKPVKVDLLDNLVTFYLILNDTDSAMKNLMEARSLYVELKQPDNEAATENNIGALYLEIGNNEEAYKYLDQSLQLRKKNGDRCGLPATLTGLGLYYYAVDQKVKAKEFLLDQALPLYPPGGECASDKAQTLISIGKFYYDLGSNDLALKYLAEAEDFLKINLVALQPLDPTDFGAQSQFIKNKSDTATALNYIGAANFALAKNQEAAISLITSNPGKVSEANAHVKDLYEKAQSSYKEALKLYREIFDKKHEATVMTNIGVVQSTSGQTDEALKIFDEALTVSRGDDDKNAEAITLNNIGETYLARGDQHRALEFFNRALPLLKAVNDRSGEAVALTDSMYAWSRIGNRRMAIFCGKQAINIFQDIRGATRGLDTEIQKDYLRSIRSSYQHLAELLIEERLYAQAVETLNLYQDQQFFDLDRNASVGQAAFSQREHIWAQRYETESKPLAQLSLRIEEVKRAIAYRQPTNVEKSQQQNLKAEFTHAVDAFNKVLEGAEKEFAQPPDEIDKNADVTQATKMLDALKLLGETPRHKTYALYTLIARDKFFALLLTPSGIKVFSHPINSDALNKLTIKVLSALQNPGFPEKILDSSSNLYNIILGATSTDDGKNTLEAELERDKPDILLWSLDGSLSYLPVAALYDVRKSQYLVEKYQNVVFTRADVERILRSPKAWTTGIGFGKSTPSEVTCETPCDKLPCDDRLKALHLVPQEMAAIFQGTPRHPALVNGTVLLDDRFTLDSMQKGKNTPLVHIASHFCFRPGNAAESFLLLGDNNKFSLNQMRSYPDLYSGIDLLVLSACQTAALEPNQMGKEIDSLAELTQRLGAASVIATLWNADEIGASRLMIKFYRLHNLHPDWSKAELLRQAQLSLLRGNETAPDTNLEHPYYWAPFVLYGSFR
jgi:CHAT domain-containing protein